MHSIGDKESHSQARVVAFFQEALGYVYLGNWRNRTHPNRNIVPERLADWLKDSGSDSAIVTKVLREVEQAAALGGSKPLSDANRAVYSLLRYGVKVRPDASEQTQTVWLIDWKNPYANQFGIAEEVTVIGNHTKRPDIVLYVNGIALGVLELKRSTVSVAEGIRQHLDSQKPEFIRSFFSTVQLVMAGNETEGLRYGVIGTPERHWIRWKEKDAHPDAGENPLLRELSQLCGKARLLEMLHDFTVFDAGVKKLCRHNQFFGVKAAQARVKRREGGIIWHTQGSGKSLTMVWLARWIRENVPNSRVLILTDRTELDAQIQQVFLGVDEDTYRTRSGADLAAAVRDATKPLVCSLIHKFGAPGELRERDVENYLAEMRQHMPQDFSAAGEIFVFVDECHRTQSGKLHAAMKALLPDATLIGFTGTPLLKRDKPQSIKTFGAYIHTYKYDEGVRDAVVLDLRYEARDIDQGITSQTKIDRWFESKTRGLTDSAKAQLKQRWGTMQKVLSSRDRLRQIVNDILLDMATRDRLQSGRGNAMLVADSIYSACRFYEMFRETELKGKCAIITSYQLSLDSIKGEETGEGLTENLLKHDIYRKMLAEHFNEPEERASREIARFEQEVKKRFVEEPGRMKLLIVVDRMLTGFDAPSATYLYIDKQMRDHGLFQAICRVNRLDSADKEYGYIVDYKDLFCSLAQSIADYTGEAFNNYDTADVAGLLKNRIQQGRERLEETREAIHALCEPVAPPHKVTDYLRYFCAEESGNAAQLEANAPKRAALYQLTSAFLRAYANLANEMQQAGYRPEEEQEIREEVAHYEQARRTVKLASGDYIDMKAYEPAMLHLLDTYIRAEESETLSQFDDMTLVQLIVARGEEALTQLPAPMRESREAVAETIENNVRRLLIDKTAVNPKHYANMSAVLDALIAQRRQDAMSYEAYLSEIVRLTQRLGEPEIQAADYPPRINSEALRSLFDNLGDASVEEREERALALDAAIRAAIRDEWRGNMFKEREIHQAMATVLADNAVDIDILFKIVESQSDY